jgi:alkylated DNA repair dioxygenase AlkB
MVRKTPDRLVWLELRFRFAPTEPLLAWLLPLRAKAARFAHIAAEDLVQALLIRYDPGAGIGWHRDRPVFEHVVGISLGAPATMRFRRRRAGGFDRASAELAPRSIYHLSGEARHKWEHSIAAMAVTRWSITFRSLTEKSTRVRALPGLTPPAPRPDTSRFAEGLPHDEVGRHNIGGTQSKIGCDYR